MTHENLNGGMVETRRNPSVHILACEAGGGRRKSRGQGWEVGRKGGRRAGIIYLHVDRKESLK